MSKFKVGDIVVRVNRSNGNDGAEIGQVAKVTAYRSGAVNSWIDVNYSGKEESWLEENTEQCRTAILFTREQLEFLSSHFNISEENNSC